MPDGGSLSCSPYEEYVLRFSLRLKHEDWNGRSDLKHGGWDLLGHHHAEVWRCYFCRNVVV
jgi:hypothetical protein